MLFFSARPSPAPFASPRRGAFARKWRWLGAAAAGLVLAGAGIATEPAGPTGSEFGKAIQLAPFVVQGKPLTVSIHARTKGDRRYGEKFADEVIEIAYATLGDSTGQGLIIVGAKGEPHPIHLFRKFVVLQQAGQLDPSLAGAAAELEAALVKLQGQFKVDGDDNQKMGITFDTFLPALPMPLPGVASPLYQLAWAEKFDVQRIEQRLRTLTWADLDRDELKRYDWVFYLPPHSNTSVVLNDLMAKAMKAEKLGPIKRGLIRSVLFAFRPVINKAVEGFRKGMLFQTILRSESEWSDEDIKFLAQAYAKELMPDLKPGSGDERKRALAAIEKQKIANAEYAKDPFVKPERLAAFEPAAYAMFEGEYTDQPPETTHWFKREGDGFQWNYKDHKPRPFYPAGDRLLVDTDGTMTIRFLVDEAGAVTGVEERWVRRRKTVTRKA